MGVPRTDLGWKEFFRLLFQQLQDDQATDVAAAVTFFALLAVFPFLLFLVSLASVVVEPQQAQVMVGELARVAPPDVTAILAERIEALGRQSAGGLASVSALVAIWSASGGIAALMRALNRVSGVKENRAGWKVRGIAVLVTIAAGVLLLVAVLVTVALPVATAFLDAAWLDVLIRVGRFPVAGLVVAIVWAMLFYLLPNARQRFRVFSPGAVVGVVTWLVLSGAFSFYVQNFGSYDATYGALGGVIVMLLWMWLSVIVFLVGAEINQVIDRRGQPAQPRKA